MSDKTTESGINVTELAESAARVFFTIVPKAQHWECEEAWEAVANTAIEFDENGVEETSAWVATKMYVCFAEEAGMDMLKFSTLSPRERVAWNAVGRHLAYLTGQSDQGENLGALEASWLNWAYTMTKLEELADGNGNNGVRSGGE